MIALLLAGGLSVFLTPDDACVSAILREVRLAKKEIFIQTAGVALPDVLDAFASAAKRGVKVTVDTFHPSAGTTIIIDRKTIFAGSLRLRPRAVGTLFLVKDDPDIALKFAAALVDHRGHTKAYAPSLLSEPATKLAADATSCGTCSGTKLVTCERCNGKWARVAQQFPCEKSARVGCGGTGRRNCFTCKGQATQRCTRCKGKTYYLVAKRSIGGGKRRSIYAGCKTCGGSGEGPLGSYNLRRGSGKMQCPKCVDGTIGCPRCDGEGTYEKKAKCPDCTKGKVPCPDCA